MTSSNNAGRTRSSLPGDSAAKVEFDRLHREGGAFFSATQLTRTPILVTDASDARDPILFANAAFLSFFGYTESDVVGHTVEDLCEESACQVIEELRRAIDDGHERPLEIALRRKDGKATLTTVVMFLVQDSEGYPAHHFLSFIDRAEVASANARVQELLIENARLVREVAQRELLVDETNHRVKNALMQAAMVLVMQGVHSHNREVSDALSHARERLETMAGIYDLLSTKNAKTIDLGSVLQDMVPHLVPPLMPIVVETHLAPGVLLPPELAQPLALIALELVTNAVKHAFPRRRAGRVRVDLSLHDDALELTVSDDGVGMPEGTTDSLGYKLVRGLVRQAGGTLEHARTGPGTTVRISAPLSP
ncbi:sensor histidine kinase [Telmatospirillum sp. J64-1]|uniref:sensor histidine kinase n=1 Tax=Telmatospirillum sp. J64-1 TaxID=2502183 RepID=UPI00115D245A|nr:ATP-binding protein [Telmatospirillum sp. J64-1]